MALVHFLIFLTFCIACWWVIRWLMRRYLSSKPWHRYVRWLVWLLCIGLLTFDSIYYKIVVVDGMCAADKTRVYPAPPKEYVVAGPFDEGDSKISSLLQSSESRGWMKCESRSLSKVGICIVENLKLEKTRFTLHFGGDVRGGLTKLNSPISDKVYSPSQ
jgi:hypothetical protein